MIKIANFYFSLIVDLQLQEVEPTAGGGRDLFSSFRISLSMSCL